MVLTMRAILQGSIVSWIFKGKKMAIPIAVSALSALPTIIPLLKSLVNDIKSLHGNTAPSPTALEETVSQAIVPITNLLQQNGIISGVDATQLSGAIQALIHSQEAAKPTAPVPAISGTIVNADGKSYSFSGTVVLTPQ